MKPERMDDDWYWDCAPSPGTVGGAHAVSCDCPEIDIVDRLRAVASEVTGKDFSRPRRGFGFLNG